jgi:hypothetical protein
MFTETSSFAGPEARRDLFGYIKGFYNPRRLHSSLGYIQPRLGRVDKMPDPQTDGRDEDEAEEAVGGFVIAGGQSAAVFQL